MKNILSSRRGIHSFSAFRFPWPVKPLCFTGLLSAFCFSAWGQVPPDLTTNPVVDTTYTFNLGPTGARGWIYVEGGEWALQIINTLSIKSRQILITQVDAGTPAAGVLQVNDVILGIGATLFTNDARKAFGSAITEAEKTANGGQLRLKVWRSGVTNNNVTVTLPVMGSYSATAPYNCPKSALILSNACNYMATRTINSGGDYGDGLIGLALLAAGRTQDVAKLQTYARTLASVPVSAVNKGAWGLGSSGTFLSEYYLATGDANVLPAVISYTTNTAIAQNWVGTYGHGIAWPRYDGSSTHGFTPPYGSLKQAGILADIAIVLGQKCMGGQDVSSATETNIIANAITRARTFFGWYAFKGAVPYGESPAEPFHDDNGKNAEAALLLSLQSQADMSTQVQFFVKGCTAGYAVRDCGHPNAFWAQLWQPLGANLGGTNALAAYFQQIQWEADLARRPNGSFAFNHCVGGQPGVEAVGTDSDTAKWMLCYATALQKICLTGKNSSTNNWLSTNDVSEAIADGICTLQTDMKSWTTNRLLAAATSWSPWKRYCVVHELSTRTSAFSRLVPMLISMAEGTNVYGRMTATEALGLIKDTSALPVLIRRLNDTDYHVRWLAAGGYNTSSSLLYSTAARPVLTNMLSIIISNEVPYYPPNWADPCQQAQGSLESATLRGALGGSVSGVPTNLLYGAIRTTTRSTSRADALVNFFQTGTLSANDVRALAQAILYTVESSPEFADIWSGQGAISLLARYGFEEGIAAAMTFRNVHGNPAIGDMRGWYAFGQPDIAVNALASYGSAARATLPELTALNQNAAIMYQLGYGSPGGLSTVISTIQNDTSSHSLLYFKSFGAAAASPATFGPPSYSTTLSASGRDMDGGTLVYIWSKVRGAGPVTFSPNGTTASSNCTASFSVPGNYVLRATIADGSIGDGATAYSGLTTNLTVTFGTVTGNQPPQVSTIVANLMQNGSLTFTLTGTDPEGYELYYSILTQPSHGTLVGAVPSKPAYTLPGVLPTVTYTPTTSYYGPDSFTYTVMDSEGLVATNTVALTVNMVGMPWIPAGVTASAVSGRVLLNWAAASGALGYNVKRSLTSGGSYAVIGATAGTAYADSAVVNGTAYYYVVSATNNTGQSANSTQVTATPVAPPVPGVPVGLAASGANPRPQVVLSWSASSDAWAYNVKRSQTSGGPYTVIGAAAGTAYTDSAVIFGTNYYYVVSATNSTGESANSAPAGAIPVLASPAAPTILSVLPGNTKVGLTWALSAGATGYNVKRSQTSGGPHSLLGSLSGTSYTNNGLINGTTYYYVVSATNAAGQGPNSIQVSATPLLNGPAYYFDVNGATAGFGSPSGTYNLSGNYWSADGTGQTAPAAVPGGSQLTFGNVGSDFAGNTFTNNLDSNNSIGGILVNSASASVTLAGTDNSLPANNSTWLVAAGSTLNQNNTYGGNPGMNWNGAAVTLAGGGTINFNQSIGFNCNWTGLVTVNGVGLTVNLAASASTTPWIGLTLQQGTLNFASAASANTFAYLEGANASQSSTAYFTINGGAVDNTSGSPMTLQVGTAIGTDWGGNANGGGKIKIGGDFTFAGSSDLSFGATPVTLTATPQITVTKNTLTIGGVISGSSYGLTKASAGTLTLTNANTYTGTTTISAGTLALGGGGSILNSTNINIAGGGTYDVSAAAAATVGAGTLGAGQTLQVSGSTTGGTLATAASHGLTLNSASPLQFTAFKPAALGGAIPLTLSDAGALTLGGTAR